MTMEQWRPYQGTTQYVGTGKEPEPYSPKEELAYWVLAQRVDKPMTVMEIYEQATGKMGLSTIDTADLVKAASRLGYLRKV